MITSGSNGTTISGSLRPVGNRRDRQRLARWVGPGERPDGMAGRYLHYPPGCCALSQAAALRDDAWQSHAS
jgi:hypothetical protein